MQLVKYNPFLATLSNAGVFTNLHPAKLVWAKDWSSLIAIRIFGLIFTDASFIDVPQETATDATIPVTSAFDFIYLSFQNLFSFIFSVTLLEIKILIS